MNGQSVIDWVSELKKERFSEWVSSLKLYEVKHV